MPAGNICQGEYAGVLLSAVMSRAAKKFDMELFFRALAEREVGDDLVAGNSQPGSELHCAGEKRRSDSHPWSHAPPGSSCASRMT